MSGRKQDESVGSAMSEADTPRISSIEMTQSWYIVPPVPTCAKTPQLQLYFKTGIVRTNNIDSPDNLICLCGTCHDAFDMRKPAWVFLPCRLEPFLIAEGGFQTTRRDNPRAIRQRVHRSKVLFKPYLIREGFITLPPGENGAPRRWHGDPVLAILRSCVILHGLPRLPFDKGGLPPAVVEMYIALNALYAAALQPRAVLDTITLQPVETAVEATGATESSVQDDASDNRSVGTSAVTGRSVGSTTEARPIWPLLQPRKKGNKRLAAADSVSEIASEAPSDQTGHSNDTQHTRSVPQMRAAKRARVDGDVSARGASRWVAAIPEKRGQGKDK